MAVPVTEAAVCLRESQGDFLAQQRIELKVGVIRQAVYLEAEQLVDRFAAGKAFDHQGNIGR